MEWYLIYIVEVARGGGNRGVETPRYPMCMRGLRTRPAYQTSHPLLAFISTNDPRQRISPW